MLNSAAKLKRFTTSNAGPIQRPPPASSCRLPHNGSQRFRQPARRGPCHVHAHTNSTPSPWRLVHGLTIGRHGRRQFQSREPQRTASQWFSQCPGIEWTHSLEPCRSLSRCVPAGATPLTRPRRQNSRLCVVLWEFSRAPRRSGACWLHSQGVARAVWMGTTQIADAMWVLFSAWPGLRARPCCLRALRPSAS